MIRYLAALLALAACTAQAEVLEGRVIAVADGDTITILDTSKQQHRIRINGVYVPEMSSAKRCGFELNRREKGLGSIF